jgi:hypothetical protein
MRITQPFDFTQGREPVERQTGVFRQPPSRDRCRSTPEACSAEAMDERELEQGYANFHRKLNRILRSRDVRAFKNHIAGNPSQADRLSHCFGLSDELTKVEMFKAILLRSALKDMHREALRSVLTGYLTRRNRPGYSSPKLRQ